MLNSCKISKHDLINRSCSPDFTWKIEGIEEMLDRRKTCSKISEKTFVCNAYPQVEARAKLTVDVESGLASMGLVLIPRHHAGPHPEIRPVPTVHYVLLDRLYCRTNGEKKPEHAVRSRHSPFGLTFNYDMTFELPLFYNSWLDSPLFKGDDSVEMEIYVEPPSIPLHSYNGILNWTIEDYQKVKRDIKSDMSEGEDSPYFYTGGNAGYKVQARFTYEKTDEWKKRETLKVRISFLSGAFDANLSRSFHHLTSVELMNPAYPSYGAEKTVYKREVPEPYELAIETDDERIIKAERLLIQIAIKPSVPLSFN